MLKTKTRIEWLYLISALLFLSGCMTGNMGELFLSGRFEQQNFKKEIDCRYLKGLIIIKVRLNGSVVPYRFILDTGASFNIISRDVAAQLGLRTKAKSTITDAHGKQSKTPFVKLEDIEMGGLHFRDLGAAVLDMDSTPQLKCYDLDGVIGLNLMRLVPLWQINYKEEKVIITDNRAALPGNSDIFMIPFETDTQRTPHIQLTVCDEKELRFMVDSGSNGGFNGNLKQLELLRNETPGDCLSLVKRYGEISGGALGALKGDAYIGRVRKLEIGDLGGNATTIHFTRNTFPKIGNRFLENYIFTLDWNAKQIFLAPLPNAKGTGQTFSYGFKFSYHEAGRYVVVNQIDGNSPASEAGIRMGDRITEINGVDVKRLSFDNYCRFFFNPDEWHGKQDVIHITIQRNKEMLYISLPKQELFNLE
ncbi:MAG: PDZ domain-containing protein [bacterium]|nr:PDZ domain-containing protein [bacterium]